MSKDWSTYDPQAEGLWGSDWRPYVGSPDRWLMTRWGVSLQRTSKGWIARAPYRRWETCNRVARAQTPFQALVKLLGRPIKVGPYQYYPGKPRVTRTGNSRQVYFSPVTGVDTLYKVCQGDWVYRNSGHCYSALSALLRGLEGQLADAQQDLTEVLQRIAALRPTVTTVRNALEVLAQRTIPLA
jgi:hypothetical protein